MTPHKGCPQLKKILRSRNPQFQLYNPQTQSASRKNTQLEIADILALHTLDLCTPITAMISWVLILFFDVMGPVVIRRRVF